MAKSSTLRIYCLCIFSFAFFGSCNRNEPEFDPLIFTEDVLYLSGEITRLSGRIVSGSEVNVIDHGFHISSDETFSDLITISLGSTELPGPFIGTYEELSTETNYFVRAFMIIDNELKVGAVVEITTLGPEFTSFSPTTRITGQIVTISGKNLTKDTEVFFGTVSAEIVENKFESLLRVRVPRPVEGAYVVPISVLSDGKRRVSTDSFEYLIGKWTKISDFPGPSSVGRNAFFSFQGGFYAGIAIDEITDEQSFWKYDLATSTWSQKDFSGTFVKNPGFFEGGFLGGEIDFVLPRNFIMSTEFWLLNEVGEFEMEGTLPFEVHNPVVFRQDNGLFLFGGFGTFGELGEFRGFDGFKSEVWRYSFEEKSWSLINTTPIGIAGKYPSFKHNGMMYFVSRDDRHFYRYNPIENSWVQLSTFPGLASDFAIGVATNDRAYIGMSPMEQRIFEYDFGNDSWKEKIAIPRFDADIVQAYYTFNNRIFVMISRDFGNGAPELYEFEPGTF